MTRTTVKLGGACLLLGVVLLMGPTFGYGTVLSERGIFIQTSGDSGGLLELNDRSADAALLDSGDSTVLYELESNTGTLRPADVDATVVRTIENGSSETDPPLELTPVETDPGVVALRLSCTADGYSETGAIEVEIEAVTGGSSVAATRTTGDAVSMTCGEPGPDDVFVEEDEAGDVRAVGNVTVEGSTDVAGNIDAGGYVEVENGGTVAGNVDAAEDVEIGNSGSVSGNVTSGGDTSIANNGVVGGGIESDGSIDISNNGNIGDTIIADGDITISNNGVIEGDVISLNGDITISSNGEVRGDVIAENGTVCLGNNVVVTGDVIAESTC